MKNLGVNTADMFSAGSAWLHWMMILCFDIMMPVRAVADWVTQEFRLFGIVHR